MKKEELMYEGKAKRVYRTDVESVVIHEYKDDATAFDGKKKGTIVGKGEINATMSAIVFEYLEKKGIDTHFIEQISPNVIVTRLLEMMKVEVIARNVAAGSLAKRIGYEEGEDLSHPIVEFYYKSDELGDPMLTIDHIFELGLATEDEIGVLRKTAFKVNDLMKPFFARRGMRLIDFKLEFGKKDGNIVLADEFSPDTCRLWDMDTGEKMDKDRFRRDLGRVEETYQEVLERVKGEAEKSEVRIYVTPRVGVLDPQGQAALKGLHSLSYNEVEDVRVGRYILLEISADEPEKLNMRLNEMCEKLLANPIVEDYRFEIIR